MDPSLLSDDVNTWLAPGFKLRATEPMPPTNHYFTTREAAYSSTIVTLFSVTRFTVGQNIFAVIASKLISFNMTQPLWSWFNEVQYFNKSSISPFVYLEKAGHYTQVAWANSYYLGCGYIAYTNSSTKNVWHTMVCNYGPAGNYVGGNMYNTTGEPCTACSSGSGCSAEYEGLCARRLTSDVLIICVSLHADNVKPKLVVGQYTNPLVLLTLLSTYNNNWFLRPQNCNEGQTVFNIASCGTNYRQGVTAAERDELLKAHTTYRSSVAQGNEGRGQPGPQPAASNMQQMVWDNELARLAQYWANQSKFAHNKCGGILKRFFDIGQNAYQYPYNMLNMTHAVESWFNVVQYFGRGLINNFIIGDTLAMVPNMHAFRHHRKRNLVFLFWLRFGFMVETGHYTQVAWAECRYLGCCQMSYKEGNQERTLLVGNYGPSGNLPGSTMYNTTGQPCSACPSKKCSANYAALCACPQSLQRRRHPQHLEQHPVSTPPRAWPSIHTPENDARVHNSIKSYINHLRGLLLSVASRNRYNA
ncbi:hypothetical protein PR048_006938 [Dryococelus australis]|uniref:SCP domain-containing protein n=1 Tax=Dryococelus australis TaxID=614101 RepID=A0ABQ9ICC1_9NEOP|nr:hypothetical protein PR048_006938 [Dryococelus australis]